MMSVEAFSLAQFHEGVLERKLGIFVEDYGLESKPVLVFQSMPLVAVAVDVTNGAIQTAMNEGAGALSDTGWWCTFRADGRSALVFDGLASSSKAAEQGWASEVHEDGHFMAGLWTFPDINKNGQEPRPVVMSFYVEAFRDFGIVARKMYEAASYSGGVALTCTLLRANQLPLLVASGSTITSAVTRSVLKWPVQKAANLAAIDGVCASMAGRFMRAYGKKAVHW